MRRRLLLDRTNHAPVRLGHSFSCKCWLCKRASRSSRDPTLQFHLDYQSVCVKGILWPHRGWRGMRQNHEFKENQKDRRSRSQVECEFFLSCSYHDFHLLPSLRSATPERGYLSINQRHNRSRSMVSLLSSEGPVCFKTHFFFFVVVLCWHPWERQAYLTERQRECVEKKKHTDASEGIKQPSKSSRWIAHQFLATGAAANSMRARKQREQEEEK